MTLRARKTLFYALVLAFIALGAGATLYAQGWRLDRQFAVKKVGAIYVQSVPRDADITLDGKPIKRTSGFFEAGTLINGLFPQTHTLALSRSGFRPWKRTLSVEPSKVTEAKYAVLVPEVAVDVATSSIKNFNNVATPSTNFSALLVKLRIPRITTKKIVALTTSSPMVAWAVVSPAETTSTIFLYDEERLTTSTMPGELAGVTKKLAWVRAGLLAVLQSDGGLYLSRDGSAFERLASDVRDFTPTADGSKIAVLAHKSMEIFSLDTKDYWRFNTQGVEQISMLSWFSDNHNLFLHFPDKVMMLDLDDSAQENITLVAETPHGVYDAESRKFYFLNGDKLSVLEFPEK